MKFSPDDLTGETQEILSRFIDHVTRLEDEIKKEEESDSRKTEVKVFIAENHGYELGGLIQSIKVLSENPDLHKNIQEFLSSHNFREEVLNDESSYVEIETPKMGRVDQFVFINQGDYINIVTAERRKWTKKTVERLISYIPELERIFLSPSDLRQVVQELEGGNVTGFTAKYHSYSTDKKVSIRFHGATKEDLDTVKTEFDAKPTRLEISRENSPPDTINAAIAQEGHYSFSKVKPGYENKGLNTFEYLSQALEKQDTENFKININPNRVRVGAGTVFEGFTTLELIEDDNQTEDGRSTAEKLREDILEYKQRYVFSTWEEGSYEVFDKELSEAFEITVEGSTIRLHAKEGTTSAAFRDFSTILYTNFNSTYNLEKTSKRVRA